MDLTTAIRACDDRTIVMFDRMQYDDKKKVSQFWERHIKAIEKQEIRFDPQWLIETVCDVKAGTI